MIHFVYLAEADARLDDRIDLFLGIRPADCGCDSAGTDNPIGLGMGGTLLAESTLGVGCLTLPRIPAVPGDAD